MNIVKNLIKNQKNKLFYFSLPSSGKINFHIKVSSRFEGIYTFFCASDKNLDPSFHLSLDWKRDLNVVMGRYNRSVDRWVHVKSRHSIELDNFYSVEVIYGRGKNEICVHNNAKNIFLESENINFSHEKNEIVSFGDLNNLIQKSPVVLKNFQIRKMYDGENSCIFNVQKPETLDIKGFRISG